MRGLVAKANTMKQKIKFKAISYRGQVFFFTKELDCPDFEVIPPTEFKGIVLPEKSIESQIIDWFHDQDKSNIIVENNLAAIVDYWIPKKKENRLEMLDYLKEANLPEQMILDLMAIYKEIKPLLKGKSLKTQIRMMFSHLNIGYSAASNAYKHITKILQAHTVEDARKLLS